VSNRCYLTCTDSTQIYPAAGDLPDFDPEVHTVLSSAGCVPLLWLCLFSERDLQGRKIAIEAEEPIQAEAPIALRSSALALLEGRRDFLCELFADNGGLTHHLDMFSSRLSAYPGSYLSIEYDEIGWLYAAPEEFAALVRLTLAQLDAGSPSAKEGLVELSTLMIERRFVTLDEAPNADQEDAWNYFRILGEGYIRNAPWD